jgi:signal transduction histidine kinase
VLDAEYRSFLTLVAGHIARSIADVRAVEAERRRSEALAAMDRAKTAFFSNISHEFRTPLTLMLAPLEEALAAAQPPEQVARLDTVYRNAQRLLKLVNTLLEFSRIEAGRVQASFEPTDLAAETRELSSVFRSAIERAGLRLIVQCEPLPQPVYVDHGMWEKIVLNLLSNAYKFTFEGEVELTLRAIGSQVQLAVRDTGIGVAAEELPRLFERFHRIEGARARTHEGSGIGLALVQDLVRLHGGDIRVESEPCIGTTFIVSLPLGDTHLPQDRVSPARLRESAGTTASAFVAEAMGWSFGPSEGAVAGDEGVSETRILVADDNADMREYLMHLLAQRWSVEAVADGEAALAAARRAHFDLVLTDVMMPLRDGFGLLKAMRSDPALSAIPVIMLSARAGEESRIEGLQRGADDYLIKPFSAREVLARVEAHLRRAHAEANLRVSLAEQQALLREVNHRVRNNLEVVSSLLSLQADYVDDVRARQTLAETANRVRALGAVHRLLYGAPNLAQVDLGQFAHELADGLFAFYGVTEDRVRFDVCGEPLGVDLQRAVPLGLVINELLCNALNHAFPGGRTGSIRLKIDVAGGVLEFADDGIGLPGWLDLACPPSLGLQLVQTLVQQMGGTIRVAPGPGTRYQLQFPPGQGGNDSLSRRSSAS